jgi:dTMP kinase
VRALEVVRVGEPVPDVHMLLATPAEVAASRARGRAADDATRALDTFEADDALQRRTAAMYARLAEASYLSRWTVLTPDGSGHLELPTL